MKYRHFPAAVLAAGLLFCTLFSGLTAYADDKKGELTQKQTETRQEYEAAQSALEELQNEQTQTESGVAALTGQAAELAGQITAVTDAVQNAQTVLDERQAAADAARAALAHSCFNLSGSLLAAMLLPWFVRLVELISPKGPELEVISRQIANAHTAFNVCCALLWLPFLPWMVRLVCALVPEDR